MLWTEQIYTDRHRGDYHDKVPRMDVWFLAVHHSPGQWSMKSLRTLGGRWATESSVTFRLPLKERALIWKGIG